VIDRWLGPATEVMLDMAGIRKGSRVLDVAAGAGGQSLTAARRAGDGGSVLATDISLNLVDFAARRAREAGLSNVDTASSTASSLTSRKARSMQSSRASASSTSPTNRRRCAGCGAH
jgi:ubiquinone/menaquinone biosynthesis C-methylase UbiE